MGQKIRPFSYRLGIIYNWHSRWFPKKHNFKDQLEEDVVIRRLIEKKIGASGLVSVDIERGQDNSYKIYIKAAKPGLIIGRGGKGIEELSKALDIELARLFASRKKPIPKFSVSMNIEELKRTEIAAQYIAQQVAWDLEKRLPFRRTGKRYVELVMQNKDVQGVKIRFSGRLDGTDIARREWMAKGKLPLQTIRANIDFGEATAFNTYGTVGIKVWIYKGQIFKQKK